MKYAYILCIMNKPFNRIVHVHDSNVETMFKGMVQYWHERALIQDIQQKQSCKTVCLLPMSLTEKYMY